LGDRLLWLVVEQQSHHAYHPQEQVEVSGGGWSGFAYFGTTRRPGARGSHSTSLPCLRAAAARLSICLRGLPRPGSVPYPGLQWLPAGAMVLAQVVVTRG